MAAVLTFKGLIDDQLSVKSNNNIVRFTNFLGDNDEFLRSILLKEVDQNDLPERNNHLLIAPTGSGKTESIMNIGLGENGKEPIPMVVAVPLVMLATLKYDKFTKNGKSVGLILGRYKDKNGKFIPATSNEVISSFFKKTTKKNVILCVYDSVLRFTERASTTCKDFILVIDESHHLTSSVNFRTAAINNLLKAQEKFKKTIYMTGTPEGTIHNVERDNIHYFDKRKTLQDEIINIIYYSEHPYYELYKHLSGNKVRGKKTVILLDNKDILERFQILLTKTLSEKEVVVLTSKNRDSEEAINIIVTCTISDKTEYLLTTRVISDGIDLDDKDIDAVYIVNVSDFLIKRQFLGRFRAKKHKIYELIKSNQPESKPISFNSMRADYENKLQSDPKSLIKKNYMYRSKSIENLANIKPVNFHSSLLSYMAANFVMDEINKENIYPSFQNMIAYYNKFTNYNLAIVDNPCPDDMLTLEEFDAVYNDDFSADPENLEWYLNNIPEIFIYMNRNKSSIAYQKMMLNVGTVFRKTIIDVDKFSEDNKRHLQLKYSTLVPGKKKALKKETCNTKFADVYPEIEQLIVAGFPHGKLIDIFRLGLISERREFYGFLSRMDTFLLHYLTRIYPEIKLLQELNPRLRTIGNIIEDIKIGEVYDKKELFSKVSDMKCDQFNLYELDAIFIKDVSLTKTGKTIRYTDYHDTESFFLQEGIPLNSVDSNLNGQYYGYFSSGIHNAIIEYKVEELKCSSLLIVEKQISKGLDAEANETLKQQILALDSHDVPIFYPDSPYIPMEFE